MTTQSYAATHTSSREVRCPSCGRNLGVQRGGHAGCSAVLEHKCGKCGAIVAVPSDQTQHPHI